MPVSDTILSAKIAGRYTLVTALVSAVLGFFGGKSDLIEISVLHSKELSRQSEHFEKIANDHDRDILLESWRQKIDILNQISNDFITEAKPDSLAGLDDYINKRVLLSKMFNDIEVYRFLKDYATISKQKKIRELLNNRSTALADLQKIGYQALVSKNEKNLDYQSRTKELTVAINNELKATSMLYGFICSETPHSLAN